MATRQQGMQGGMSVMGGLNSLRLSSDEIGPRSAWEAWCQSLPQYDIDPPIGSVSDHVLNQTAWLMDTLIIGRGCMSRTRIVRPPERIADGYDHLLVVLCEQGRWAGKANGVAVEAGAGDTICLDTTRPFELTNGVGEGRVTEHTFVVVPRSRLPQTVIQNPALHGFVLRSAGNRVLGAHLEAVIRCLPSLKQEEAARLTRGTIAILTAALGEIDDHNLTSEELTPAQPAMRLRIERYIERNLSSPGLTPDGIAGDLEIPRSSLYRAFSSVGGISTYIQLRRLDIACGLLFHPEEHRSIGELAETLGFDNAATFSKAFRRRFGCSPREARRNGMIPVGDTQAMFQRWAAAVASYTPAESRAACAPYEGSPAHPG